MHFIADTLLLMGKPEPSRPSHGRSALVLCAVEHGFIGGFNERLVEVALPLLGRGACLLVLGSRGAVLALERGWPADWTHPMATRCAAAPDIVQRLSAELYRRIARGEIARVEVVFARYRQAPRQPSSGACSCPSM